jgi:hypothetical protein
VALGNSDFGFGSVSFQPSIGRQWLRQFVVRPASANSCVDFSSLRSQVDAEGGNFGHSSGNNPWPFRFKTRGGPWPMHRIDFRLKRLGSSFAIVRVWWR